MGSKLMLLAIVVMTSSFILRDMLLGGEGKRASTLNSKAKGVTLETATFGAGCFWHVEDTFRKIEGVVRTAVGFEGGTLPNPSYKDVSTDLTGHAEVVQVQFDPAKVSYAKLLEAFFELHDPTTLDRQGPDFGDQYRTVIFYGSPEQKLQAESFKEKLAKSGRYNRPIVTAIMPESTFWKAEEYHQHYYEKQRQ